MFKALARFWRYLVAWVTGKVEQLEDPEVLLDQARREMQQTLARNRERAIQAITQKNMLQAEVEKLERTVRDLERKAELALQQGKRDLALQIVREKKAQEGALETMRASLQQAIETVESIKLAIRRQEEEVRVKTAQALAMKARWKQAQIQTAINKALEGISVENIESSWATAEQRIQRAEAEAAARQEMAAQSLQGRIAALQDAQIDHEAEEELAKIEQRLGCAQRPTPSPRPPLQPPWTTPTRCANWKSWSANCKRRRARATPKAARRGVQYPLCARGRKLRS
jgi:phage shock protein A